MAPLIPLPKVRLTVSPLATLLFVFLVPSLFHPSAALHPSPVSPALAACSSAGVRAQRYQLQLQLAWRALRFSSAKTNRGGTVNAICLAFFVRKPEEKVFRNVSLQKRVKVKEHLLALQRLPIDRSV